ncbi:MAG: PrsW family glutamic-type intramembrane protease [bacterium]|nr:PrsW family glutamic-type intramembrane protease [bacterium]
MRNVKLKIESPPLAIIYGIFAVMAGLLLPVLLIPVVKFTGYSEIVEEIVKALVVLLLILKMPSHGVQILIGAVFGFLFGISENFLYLNQIFQFGDLSIFWQRFLWTVPMHIITVLVILFSGLAGKKFVIFGLAGAIILHALFNSMVVNFLLQQQ